MLNSIVKIFETLVVLTFVLSIVAGLIAGALIGDEYAFFTALLGGAAGLVAGGLVCGLMATVIQINERLKKQREDLENIRSMLWRRLPEEE